jgi:hypothetical protein
MVIGWVLGSKVELVVEDIFRFLAQWKWRTRQRGIGEVTWELRRERRVEDSE